MRFNFLLETGIVNNFPDLTIGLGFFYGPLIYFYVKSLEYKDFKLSSLDFLHAVPWFFVWIARVLLNEESFSLIGIVVSVQVFTYLFLSLRSISRYQKVLQYTQSSYHSIALSWLKQFIVLMIFIGLVDIVHNISVFQLYWLEWVIYLILIASLLILITLMVFKGLRHPELFMGITKEEEAFVFEKNEKYSLSRLSSEEAEQVARQIQEYMSVAKPYFDPQLNLQTLAEELDISARTISQVINSRFGQNFSEFVNDYRIKEAIQLLSNKKETTKTVLEILYEVGFNSKSNFYAAFKQQTGESPNTFRKRILG
jgi:AraC-like DNA-binding protein